MTAPHNRAAAELVPDLLDAGGAIAVCVQAGVSDFHVQAALEQMLRGKRRWAGFECTRPLCVSAIPRSAAAAKQYQRAAPELLAPESGFRLLSSTTTSGVDLLSREGRALALAELGGDPGVVTLHLGPFGKDLVKRAQGLTEFLEALTQTSAAKVVLFNGEPTDQSSAITLAFDNVLVVKDAEPDPGMSRAYSVGWTPQSVLACSARAPHFEQYGFGADGVRQDRSDVFVAKDHLSRRIYLMRQRGATLEQIGRKLDLDKSNVSRRLACLPPITATRASSDDFDT